MKKLLLLSLLLFILFSLNVNAVAPSWTSPIADQTVLENSVFAVYDTNLTTNAPGVASDSDNNPLTFTIPTGGEDITKVNCDVSLSGNQLSGTPVSGFTGIASCTVRATDNEAVPLFADDTFTITVNPIVSIGGLTNNVLTVSSQKDLITTRSFTLTNNGASPLTVNVALPSTTSFTDDDQDTIILTTSTTNPITVNQGSPVTVDVKADVNDDMDVGTYTGQVTITPTGYQARTFNLEVRVDPEICSDGRASDGNSISSNDAGNLRVSDIDDPDSGDDFSPGDKIKVSGTVENHDDDDHDVIVEATLYNIDEDKIIVRAESDSFQVDEDDEEDFDFELEVPLSDDDLDEDDEFVLFVKVNEDGDEDENCNYDDLKLDFERKNDQVAITKATVTPSLVQCSANANFIVDVQNVGSDDQERVSIKLREAELGLEYESELFDLDEFDKSGDSNTITYTYKIPANAPEKDYFIDTIVVFDGGKKTDSEFVKLTVKGCGGIASESNVGISLIQSTVTASQGKLFGFPFKVSNLASTQQAFTVEVTPIGSWADKPQTQTATLQAGEETTLYSYLTPKADLSPGSYNLEVKVKQDGNTLKTQTATVQIGQTSTGPTGSTVFQPTVTLSSVWRNLAGSTAFWIVAIIVVFTLVIYVLTILLRPK